MPDVFDAIAPEKDVFDQVSSGDVFDQLTPEPKAAFFQGARRAGLESIGSTLEGLAAIGEAPSGSVYTPTGSNANKPRPPGHFIRGGVFIADPTETPAETLAITQRSPVYVAGQALKDVAPETFPLSPSEEASKWTQAGKMAGGFAPYMATGPLAPIAMGAATVGDHLETDFEKAKQAGLDDEKAAKEALDKAFTSGAVQTGIFSVMPPVLRGTLEKYVVSRFGQAGLSRFLGGRVAAATEGAAVGATSKAGENIVEREPVTSGVGGAAGGLAAMNLLLPWLRDTAKAPANVPQRTFTTSTPKGNVVDALQNIDPLQMRQSTTSGREILSKLSQDTHEALAELQSAEQGAAPENELSVLRARLSQARKAEETALQSLRQPEQPNAPPGLQKSTEGELALSQAPSGVAPPSVENAPGRAEGVTTPTTPTTTPPTPTPESTAPRVVLTPDVAANLVDVLTKGQIRIGEEKRPELTEAGQARAAAAAQREVEVAKAVPEPTPEPVTTPVPEPAPIPSEEVPMEFPPKAEAPKELTDEQVGLKPPEPPKPDIIDKAAELVNAPEEPPMSISPPSNEAAKMDMPATRPADPVTDALDKATEALQAAKVEHERAKLPPEAQTVPFPMQAAEESAKRTQPKGIAKTVRNVGKNPLQGEGGFITLPSRQELVDHFSDLGDDIKNAAKTVWNQRRRLIDRIKRNPTVDTISKLKDAAENNAGLMGKQTGNAVRHELNRSFGVAPEKVRTERNDLREMALTFRVEAGEDRTVLGRWRDMIEESKLVSDKWKRRALRAISFAEQNWDKLSPAAETYANITTAENQYENANGVRTLYRKDGYVFHAQDMNATYNIDQGAAGGPGVATPFRKGRDYPTYAESIAAGVTPRNLNAVDLLEHRIKIGQKAVNLGDWVDTLNDLKDPATGLELAVKPEWVERKGQLGPGGKTETQGYWKVPQGYQIENFGGRQFGLHKGYAGLFSNLTDPSWVRKTEAGRAFQQAIALAKSSALVFDSYHLGRVAFWNAMSRLGAPTYERGLTILENTLPELKGMLARGEIPEKWGRDLIESKTRLDAIMREGGNLSGVGDNLHTEFLRRIPGIGTFNKFLFDKYQRGAMAEVALIEFQRQAKLNPADSLNTIARRVARQVNIRFGNLQSQGWLKSKTGQDLARVLFLAPQWNESLIRAEVGALAQLGRAGLNIAQGKRPALGMLARGIGTAVLGTFIANQLINMYTRGHPTWENPEEEAGAKISAWIPDKVGGGPGFFLNPLSLPAEMMNLLYRGIERHHGDEDAISQSVQAMLKGRLSSLSRGVWTWATGETPMGVQVGHGVGPAIKEALPVPISGGALYRAGKQVVTGEHQEKYPGEFQRQVFQSGGMKLESAPDAGRRMYSLAKEFEKSKGVPQSPTHEQPFYKELTDAITRGNMQDAQDALEKILSTAKGSGEPHTLEDVRKYYREFPQRNFTANNVLERDFRNSLSPEQRATYDRARADRKAIADKVLDLTYQHVTR